MPGADAASPMCAVLVSCRAALFAVALFSAVANLLLLTGPLFMLLVYDRVLASHSVPTLVALLLLATILFAYFTAIDIVRARVLCRIGTAIDHTQALNLFSATLRMPLRYSSWPGAADPLRDLNTVRQFFAGPAPLAAFDLPWLPLYLCFVFLLHLWLGVAATIGAIILIALTLANEYLTRKSNRSAIDLYASSQSVAASGQSNAEAVRAMGMEGDLARMWQELRCKFLAAQTGTADLSGAISSTIKGLRLLLQSSMLAVGAYLAIIQEVTAGTMIAASIIAARALAPVEQVVGNWRGYLEMAQAWRRLDKVLAESAPPSRFNLPRPERALEVADLQVVPLGLEQPVLKGVKFRLEAGEALGVIGPSGAGKSSLARALMSIWPAHAGEIRLDEAKLDQWDPCVLGRHVGYLPQAVELMRGTVSQNISRFDPEADPDEIIAAAQLAGVHNLILRLPDGYNTPIGVAGGALSAGQRQRVALARAVFRQPFLIVLDEPNSNLDEAGEKALIGAIAACRQQGSIVVVMSHSRAVVAACDKVLALVDGLQFAYGSRDHVLRRTLAAQPRHKAIA